MLVRARLGDVVADGVGLAGVGDTAGTALALRHHGKLAVHRRARQRPAVHLPLLWSRWERQFEIDRRLREKKFKNNPCKHTRPFPRAKQVIHANTHISSDIVYLHARGSVST